jgi:hypothetical protein
MLSLRCSDDRGTSRTAWLDGVRMRAGDGAAVSDASALRPSALEETEGLLFDLA